MSPCDPNLSQPLGNHRSLTLRVASAAGRLRSDGQCGSNPWRSDGAITSGLPTMQELSHRVRAKRRAACALLKAQGIGHPRGVYWIGGAPPLLHLLFYKVVENNVAGNCVDGLDLPPLTEDHKIQLRIRGRDESTCAVRIYGVGARNIDWRD